MSTIIFRNVRLFDGTNVHAKATVTVGPDGLIASVDTSETAPKSTSGATVIEGDDLFLLPGLIDSHIHAHIHEGNGSEVLEPALQCGITTLFDMHNEPEDAIYLKAECAKSAKLPDLKSAMYGATIEGGWPKPIVLLLDPSEKNQQKVAQWPSVTVENAEDFVIKTKAQGGDYIKLMQEDGAAMSFPHHIPAATLEIQTAVVNAAHKHGLLAVGHATSVGSTMLILKSGADGLTHTFTDKAITPEVIEAYKKTNAFLIPTLVVCSSMTGEEQHLREKFAELARSKGYSTAQHLGCMCKTLSMKAPSCTIEHAYDSVRQLKAAGIDILAGTDSVANLAGTAIGPSIWMELELYVEKCGMTPVEALRSATSVIARRFGLEDRGTVEAGRRADLLLVKGDVAKDINCVSNIVGVWKCGKRLEHA